MKDSLYKLMNWPRIEAIIYAEENKPADILGAHQVGTKVLFQAFFPGADKVSVKVGGRKYTMEMADEEGFYAALVSTSLSNSYQYIVSYDGKENAIEDDCSKKYFSQGDV